MKADILLTHYERIADAPDAIARLRRFILDMAVRGKLVPQNPHDTSPPFALRSNDASIQTSSFAVPPSWAWIEVGAVADTRLGKMLDKAKNRGTLRPYLRNINVRWFDFDLSDLNEMPFEDSELSEYALQSGDVLVCEGGEPGRAAVWDDRIAGVYFQKAIHRVRFDPAIVNSNYFVRALRASASDGRLKEFFTGTGIQHFTGRSLAAYRFPLPPLAEQHRIVAKVDELMALCDRLEEARAKREATRDRLTAASLARLNAPDPDPATFANHARFALNALPALTTRPDQVKQLRQTILNLAVRGKLVPQDSSDEPASELLKRITKEKARASKRGKAEAEIDNADELGKLPASWQVVPLIALGSWAIGSGFPKNEQGSDSGSHFFLKVSDMNLPGNEKYITNSNNFIDDDAARRMRAKIHPAGTIIFPKIGGAIATNKRRILTTGSAIDNNCLGITFASELDVEWAFLLLSALDFTRYQVGTAVPALQQGVLERIPVGLPPIGEQQRIVAKVDDLMALCDQLEASLNTSDDTHRRLLDALLAEALTTHEHQDKAA